MSKPSIHYNEEVLNAEYRDEQGDWQQVMVFDGSVDSRFALVNPNGCYRCEIDGDGARRVEYFRVVGHQLAAPPGSPDSFGSSSSSFLLIQRSCFSRSPRLASRSSPSSGAGFDAEVAAINEAHQCSLQAEAERERTEAIWRVEDQIAYETGDY